jgi:alpha-L-rhamnosidase
VSWTRGTDGRVTMTVTVPANTTAEIWVPVSSQPQSTAGATFTRIASSSGIRYAVYSAGPGTYWFSGPS